MEWYFIILIVTVNLIINLIDKIHHYTREEY